MRMNTPSQLFNRTLLQKRQQRTVPHCEDADFFIKHVSSLLQDRLEDITRHFTQATLIGGYHGCVQEALQGTKNIRALDVIELGVGETLPLSPASQDAIFSAWGLHWINDLPGMLSQIRRALKPDGCFVALMPGPKTLQELRESFAAAAASSGGDLHNHIAPFVEVRDAGNLLQRAGFALPVVDSETLEISYPHPMKLLHELRAMGETNMLLSQSKQTLPRAYFAQMMAAYQQRFSHDEGRITATVEIISMTAWAPDASQPKPAKRGSGEVSLKDFL